MNGDRDAFLFVRDTPIHNQSNLEINAMHVFAIYPLVNVYTTMKRSTMFHGKPNGIIKWANVKNSYLTIMKPEGSNKNAMLVC